MRNIQLATIAAIVLMSVSALTEDEDPFWDCDALPEDEQALCKLLAACSQIEDEEVRERCLEAALEDESDEVNVYEDGFDWPLQTQDRQPEATADEEEQAAEEPVKRRGLFGRIGRLVSSPIRAVLGGDGKDEKKEEVKTVENTQDEDDENEEVRETISWDAEIEKTGRIDRNVHLVLLSDGKLFEYIAPETLRFRKGEDVTVIHVNTWLTERFRLKGARGPTRDASLIPCHREDLKGNLKRKCKLMGVD